MDATAAMRADADEYAILGAYILDPTLVATTPLSPADFFLDDSKETFGAMQAISQRGDLPIWTTLVQEIMYRGDLVSPWRILLWVNECPTPAFHKYHAMNILRASQRRKLLTATQSAAHLALDPTLSSEDAVRSASDLVARARMLHVGGPDVMPMQAAIIDFAKRKAELREGRTDTVPTGFYDLDEYLGGGLRPSQLCIVGGRPGMGKSAILRDMARTVAQRGRVLFASNEMGTAGLVDRDISVLSRVDLGRVIKGQCDTDEWARVFDATAAIEFLPLLNYVDGGMTSEGLRAYAEREHAQEPFVAIFVDYLQRMADGGRNDLERVSKTARALKSIAMTLRVPVIAGSQLSRASEGQKKDAKPTLTDLRSSGEIEQEADVVLLLYRAAYYYPNELAWVNEGKHRTTPYPGNSAEVIIAKQRQGESGRDRESAVGAPVRDVSESDDEE